MQEPATSAPAAARTIFLSYRRDDRRETTIRINGWLRAHGVPEAEIFFDQRAIPAGQPFPHEIEEALKSARCVLVIMGRGWAAHKRGGLFARPSLFHKDDWVRREVELALAVAGRTLPVLAGGARMPAERDLPPSLRPLRSLQAVELRIDDAGFEEDMAKLAQAIAQRLDGIMQWVDGRFVPLGGARRAYLDALEQRTASLELPVAGEIRLGFEDIYQPLRLAKDPLHPADQPRERKERRDADERESGGERGDTFARDGRAARRPERMGDGRAEEAGEVGRGPAPARTRAEDGAQALRQTPARRMVVLGGPGTGKSTLIRHFIRDAARAAIGDASQPLPILLSLPELARSGEWTREALPLHLRRVLENINRALPVEAQVPTTYADTLAAALFSGDAFLCLDGLDEVLPSLRPEIIGWIRNLPAPRGEAALVIGSRFTEYKGGDLPAGQFYEWELEPLTPANQQQLAHALLLRLGPALRSHETPPDEQAFLKTLRGHETVGWWAENPLLFTLAAFVYVKRGSLPAARVALYDEVVTSILRDRLERDGTFSDFTLETTQDVLGLVALDLFRDVGQAFTTGDLTRYVRASCADVRITGETDMDALFQRALRSGLMDPQTSETYKFRHPTFHEYLAAAGLAYRLTAPNLRRDPDPWADPWRATASLRTFSRWSEPLSLMAGVLAHKRGEPGLRAVERWIGELSRARLAGDDPGYLKLCLAIHSLRDMGAGAGGAFRDLARSCVAAWAEALRDAVRQDRDALKRRLMTVVPDIAAIA